VVRHLLYFFYTHLLILVLVSNSATSYVPVCIPDWPIVSLVLVDLLGSSRSSRTTRAATERDDEQDNKHNARRRSPCARQPLAWQEHWSSRVPKQLLCSTALSLTYEIGSTLSDLDGRTVRGTPKIQKCLCDFELFTDCPTRGTDRPRLGHGSPAATPTSVLGGVCFYGFLGVYRGHSK